MRSLISTVCDLAGFAAIAGGLYMLTPWLGFVAGGVALLALAVVIERKPRPISPESSEM